MLGRRLRVFVSVTIAILSVAVASLVVAQGPDEAPDLVMYGRIRDEGQARSQVMRYATELMDGIGSRLTGSPNVKEATLWVVDRLKQMGLSNVRTESWGEFGMGWQQRNVWLRMIDPDLAMFIAVAAPWSPATAGAVTAEVVAVRGFTSEREFEAHRGRLRGKIVLLGRAPGPPEVIPIQRPLFERLDEKQLAEHARPPIDGRDTDDQENEKAFAQVEFGRQVGRFLASEGVRAVIVPSGDRPTGGLSGGTLWADGNAGFGWFAYQKAHAMHVPLVIVANEHYGRMKRLLDQNVPVKLELNVDTEFTSDREEGLNVFGEIAGIDAQRKDEVVMVGAHLDSWAAGTGATDDGAGVVIAMEAMRILNALQVQPTRTIRIALWTGEEQGALGSLEYVKRHVATIPRANTPAQMRVPEFIRQTTGPMVRNSSTRDCRRCSTSTPVGEGFAASASAAPHWFRFRAVDCSATRPGHDDGLGAQRLWRGLQTIRTGTVYRRRSSNRIRWTTVLVPHHTNMDTYEHLLAEDLRQAATIVATLLHNTAKRDRMLPRTQ